MRRLLGVDLGRFDELALSAQPGAGGLVLLPYLDGERTPNLPDATGTPAGLTRATMTPANLARACVEGMLCGLADAVDAVVAVRACSRVGCCSSAARRALAGGACRRTTAVRAAGACAATGEYVAEGAARQAAWALAGGAEPPRWHAARRRVLEADPTPQVREAYAAVRDSYAR